jgi:hypothetical protein
MAEGRRKPYTRPAVEDRGQITEQTLQFLNPSQEAADPDQQELERVPRSRAGSTLEGRQGRDHSGGRRPARGAP